MGELSEELKYWVAFHRVLGLGPQRFNRMESYFGSLESAWQAEAGELRDAGIAPGLVEEIDTARSSIDPDLEVDRLLRSGITPIHMRSEKYPDLLAEVDDAPPVIYVCGELLPKDLGGIAIVGTRDATSYGVEMASRISGELSSMGVTVVSGLARGIDTAAHRASLRAGGRTIGVMAGGLDAIYPASNRGLARQIVDSGCLLSEYRLGARTKREHFPRRNRIISGLSRGVVVVEAAKKSGATWTVKWALEQNREVFAVPGNATSSKSEGTNWLIQQGAKLTTCAQDIVDELSTFFSDLERDPDVVYRQTQSEVNAAVRGSTASSTASNGRAETANPAPIPPPLITGSDEERAIVDLLIEAGGPMHVDEIARSLKRPVTDVMSTLTMMEVGATVRTIEGALYALSHGATQMATPRLFDGNNGS